jgi:Ran GTPase-activating protein (RanGAP) involved in mRNA processing and transport
MSFSFFKDLSFNKISKKTFEILVNTLDHLSSLLYLSLADCGIQDSYGRCIGDVCRHDRLTEINLSGNEFEEMACIFIGSALSMKIYLLIRDGV